MKCKNTGCDHVFVKNYSVNIYDHNWQYNINLPKVCPECGFKTLKEGTAFDLMSDEEKQKWKIEATKLFKELEEKRCK